MKTTPKSLNLSEEELERLVEFFKILIEIDAKDQDLDLDTTDTGSVSYC